METYQMKLAQSLVAQWEPNQNVRDKQSGSRSGREETVTEKASRGSTFPVRRGGLFICLYVLTEAV